jgi:hypothetical protein
VPAHIAISFVFAMVLHFWIDVALDKLMRGVNSKPHAVTQTQMHTNASASDTVASADMA